MTLTQSSAELQSWLNHLSVLFPAESVVHVGAGSGFAASRYAQWGVPRLMLLEADAGLARKLPDSIGPREGWMARNALVGAASGEQVFYVATNPNESSVIEPESLSFLWRNLRARERRTLSMTTIDATLADADWPADTLNWLVADCLPALPVLQGAAGHLANCDVVLARVLLAGGPNLAGAGAAEVDDYLCGLGFRSVTRVEERMPAIATAIYVREWSRTQPAVKPLPDEGAPLRESASELARAEAEAMLASTTAKLSEASERLAISEARTEALVQLSRDQEQGIAAYVASVAELNRSRTGLEADIASLRAQLERQTREHDDEALLQALQLAESKASLTQAAQIQARLENRIAEQQGRIDELSRGAQEQTELAIQRADQVTQLNRACEELIQQATQRQARLDELTRAVETAAIDKAAQKSQIESLQAQLLAIQAAKEEAAKAAAITTAELEQVRQALGQREQSLEETAQRISALQAELASAVLERDGIASRLASEHAHAQQILESKLALDTALSSQSQLLTAHETTNAKLAEERLQQMNLAAHRLAQVEALQAEKAAAIASAALLEAEVSRGLAAYEAERANAAELAANLQRIARDSDEHARLSAERMAQVEQLREENAQALARIAAQQTELAGIQELSDRLQRISRDHDEHARVSRERLAHIEKLLGEAEARNARISQLEAERSELDYRQRLLDEELVKAEAQIDLIKDVVLREKAF
ncbi:MAG: hypothetical protein JNN20_18415 [Betaproteobacteria bacterium]|nr:hypothetical protein [Betaproteobacteria bacterium]